MKLFFIAERIKKPFRVFIKFLFLSLDSFVIFSLPFSSQMFHKIHCSVGVCLCWLECFLSSRFIFAQFTLFVNFETDAKKSWRSRCCKQNQLDISSSNFLINNSQTNHFISHFFPTSFYLSHVHTHWMCLAVLRCVASSAAVSSCCFCLFFWRRCLPHFPIECIQFYSRGNSGCTCWFRVSHCSFLE